MSDFVMPSLGADMQEGKLLAWRKKVGETVRRGEIIADVDTDKATIEVESFATGVLEKILVEPGSTVPVGTVLGVIKEEGAPSAAAPPPARPLAGRVAISPAARKLAEELGIDPATLAGSGPGGRVTREDVERAHVARAPSAPGPLDRQERMRAAIASAVARSKREIPHYYLGTTVDVSRALAWLTEENSKRPVPDRVLPVILFIKAVALVLREVPELNALWDSAAGKVSVKEHIHVGVAISLRGGGLVAPALLDADRDSVQELMKKFRDLVARARAGSLRSSELSEPTITVTNLGDTGVEVTYGVIYPPQVALVGFGRAVERPWVVNGQVVPRTLVSVTLSADHRVTDGHRGSIFLAAIDRLLQEPEQL